MFKSLLAWVLKMVAVNWKTTVVGLIIGGLIQVFGLFNVVLTTEQINILTAMAVTAGALLPNPDSENVH